MLGRLRTQAADRSHGCRVAAALHVIHVMSVVVVCMRMCVSGVVAVHELRLSFPVWLSCSGPSCLCVLSSDGLHCPLGAFRCAQPNAHGPGAGPTPAAPRMLALPRDLLDSFVKHMSMFLLQLYVLRQRILCVSQFNC